MTLNSVESFSNFNHFYHKIIPAIFKLIPFPIFSRITNLGLQTKTNKPFYMCRKILCWTIRNKSCWVSVLSPIDWKLLGISFVIIEYIHGPHSIWFVGKKYPFSWLWWLLTIREYNEVHYLNVTIHMPGTEFYFLAWTKFLYLYTWNFQHFLEISTHHTSRIWIVKQSKKWLQYIQVCKNQGKLSG